MRRCERTSSTSSRRDVIKQPILVLLAASILAPVLLYLQHSLPFMEALLHSDALYGAFLIEDLLIDPGRYSDWHVPPNPALVPDFAGYSIAYLLTRDHYLAVPVYLVYQLVLLSLVLFCVYRRFFNPDTSLVVTLIVVSVLSFVGTNVSGPPYSLLFVSGYHTGNLIMLLLISWLFLRLLGPEHRPRDVLLLFVATFVAALSDRLIIVNTVAPLVIVVALLLLHRQLSFSHAIRLALPVILGAFGMLFTRYTMPYEVNYSNFGLAPSIYKIPWGLEILSEVIRQCYAETPGWLSIPLTLLAVIGGAAAVYHTFIMRATRQVGHAGIFCLFVLLSIACTVAALVLHAAIFPRYLLPLFYLPVILAPVALMTRRAQLLGWVRPALLLLATLLVIASGARLATGGPLRLTYYPDDVACIDKALADTHVTYGIAQYWDARYLSAYATLSSPRIAHVFANLQPYRWMISERQFRDSYDFAIIHQNTFPVYTLNEAYLIELNGLPDTTIQCGERKLLVYRENGLVTHPQGR